ncbi:hypothetical protein V501_09091 [Pseudogymnoascus sp. VKM F-4519 (FW-2642)]|uniref:HIG1 domain-containing protein n=1 Tax=Pseudogymnoascus verrucosus TaxID=342668 RepID=A0A2P2SX46_9PEZI|nr:uncharacterized protein VE01_00140 [Pseudogymnoascus verrucosus]KFY78368.1 hypothetical protein V499_02446 [Pseudogymnoascus sp. VKM F-103]KFZ04677.1 hypothetical protein V501_09091 [Pseudogymnoascus sp. VKM F-4519 (FW-2642)]OBU01439.1 hypothetical protein VE01_00140 [Pseudogymnoascus verrucosus]
MKVLTKEQEEAHYRVTLKGGMKGLALGTAVGLTGLGLASRRYAIIRGLTLPMKSFLVTSSSTFCAIIAADRASRGYEFESMPKNLYKDQASRDMAIARENDSTFDKFKQWGRDNRYPIVTASWIASMGVALQLVRNNPYLSKAQKLVQARVYAQGLTLAVLVVTALFEVGDANKGRGRWETVMVLDPNDPEHKHMIEKKIHHEMYPGEDLWKDMVEAEEQKIAARKLQDGAAAAAATKQASTKN